MYSKIDKKIIDIPLHFYLPQIWEQTLRWTFLSISLSISFYYEILYFCPYLNCTLCKAQIHRNNIKRTFVLKQYNRVEPIWGNIVGVFIKIVSTLRGKEEEGIKGLTAIKSEESAIKRVVNAADIIHRAEIRGNNLVDTLLRLRVALTGLDFSSDWYDRTV